MLGRTLERRCSSDVQSRQMFSLLEFVDSYGGQVPSNGFVKMFGPNMQIVAPHRPLRKQKNGRPSQGGLSGGSGRLEERNPQVKTTPRLLSPRVTQSCSAFDRPMSIFTMMDTVEKPTESRGRRVPVTVSHSASVYHSLSGFCRNKIRATPLRGHLRMVIFVTPVAAYVTAKPPAHA